MANQVRSGASATTTETSALESKAKSGRTKQRGRLHDNDGWGGFGGYMKAKKQKRDEQFNQGKTARKSAMFAGVAVYVNGYTNPSSDELRRLLQQNGGRYEMYLSKTWVTHIVATNLPNSKYRLAETIPVVRPEWITDSVAAGKRLSHIPYLLIGNRSKLQSGLKHLAPVSTAVKTVLEFKTNITACGFDNSETRNVKVETMEPHANCDVKFLPERFLRDSFCEVKHAKLEGQSEIIETVSHPEVKLNASDNVSIIKDDDDDDDVVYNSEEDNNNQEDKSRIRTPVLSQNDVSPYKKRSRVYSFRKIRKSNSSTFDAHGVDSSSSCDSFVEGLKSGLLDSDKGFSHKVEPFGHAVPVKYSNCDTSSGTVSLQRNLNMTKNVNSVGDMSSISCLSHASAGVCETLQSKCLQVDPDDVQGLQTEWLSLNRKSAESKMLNTPTASLPAVSGKQMDGDISATSSVSESEKSHLSLNSTSHLSLNSSRQVSCTSELSHSVLELTCPFLKQTCDSSPIAIDQRRSLSREPSHQPSASTPRGSSHQPSASSSRKSSHQPSASSFRESSHQSSASSSRESSHQPSAALPDSTSESANMSPKQPSHRSSSASCASALGPAHPSSKQTFQQPSSSSSTMAKAGDRNFLSEFYSNSRLHHIATWGAEFKAYVSEIQKSSSHSFPSREKLRQLHVENALKLGQSETLSSARHGSVQKTVMHIDMDCFFVSVGLLTRLELKGKPVAVTHSRGQGAKPNPDANFTWERDQWMKKRGNVHLKGLGTNVTEHMDTGDLKTRDPAGGKVAALGASGNTPTFQSLAEIASCSYEARKAGVKNGMFVGAALNLCPGLQTIPYDFSEYNRVSRILYDVVASYTHDIEAVSCDEMLIDCSDVLSDTGASAMEFAQMLRTEILEKTGCSSSVGIGPNILLARLATRKAKPNGQFEVTTAEAKDFIKDQHVSDLPGVGYSMCRKLTLMDVRTCGDLQKMVLTTLKQEFGPKTGEMLHRFSMGQDIREIKGDKQRKSVSAEVNYGIRFSKETEAVTFLQDLSSEVKRRMDAIGVKGRSITLKLMVRRPDAPVETAKFMGHGICNTFNKSSNLPVATSDEKVIAREVVSLYRAHRVAASDVRGIGIHINKLEQAVTAVGTSSRPRGSGHQDITSFTVQKTSNSTTTTDSALTLTATSTTSTMCVTTTCCKSIPTSSSCISPSRSITSPTPPYTSLRSSRRELSAKVNSQNINLLFHDQNDSVKKINLATHAKLLTVNSENYLDTPGPSWKVDVSESSTNEGQKFDGNTSFLSESQIDSDVLHELPAEIAQEILEDLRVRKQRKQSLSAVTPALVPAHASNSRTGSLPVPGSARCAEGAEFQGGLPSLSQLDLSCFHALPLHLQDELRAEYARQEVTTRSTDKIAVLTEENLTHLRSPIKNNRGKKANAGLKNSKQLRTRGRQQGKKVLNFGKSKVRSGRRGKDHQMDEKPRVPYLSSGVIVYVDDDDASSSRDIYANEDSSDRQHLPGVSRNLHGSEVLVDCLQTATLVRTGQAGDRLEDLTFCGSNSLGDVRKLLKEWMASCPEPQDDDVSMVTEYLIKLVQYRNLEQVFGLLRFLTRKRTSQSNSRWQESLLNITTCVQNVICACYGATLKL